MAKANLNHKIFTANTLAAQVQDWKVTGKTVVFTNGCFDILHQGHIYSLQQAAAEGDVLIVAVNSDASVKSLKGADRPINKEGSRALLLAALVMVDAVVIFNEATPETLIRQLQPQVLVKGGDYTEEQIAGAAFVKASGGRVVINPILPHFSTTGIIQKMKNSSGQQ